MRISIAFLTGLVLLWASHSSAGTVSVTEGQTDNADYVVVPCDPADSSLASIQIAQADAPILLAQVGKCAENADGTCASPGTQCGSKSNFGVCTTKSNKNTGKSNCLCSQRKQ
jgi:hypothetical protein